MCICAGLGLSISLTGEGGVLVTETIACHHDITFGGSTGAPKHGKPTPPERLQKVRQKGKRDAAVWEVFKQINELCVFGSLLSKMLHDHNEPPQCYAACRALVVGLHWCRKCDCA